MLPPPWISKKEGKKGVILFHCLPLCHHHQSHFWKVGDAVPWSGRTTEEHRRSAPALGTKSLRCMVEDFHPLTRATSGGLEMLSPLPHNKIVTSREGRKPGSHGTPKPRLFPAHQAAAHSNQKKESESPSSGISCLAPRVCSGEF